MEADLRQLKVANAMMQKQEYKDQEKRWRGDTLNSLGAR